MGAIEENCPNVTRYARMSHKCHTIQTRFLQEWQRIYATIFLLEMYCSRMHKKCMNGYEWTRIAVNANTNVTRYARMSHECHTISTNVTRMSHDTHTVWSASQNEHGRFKQFKTFVPACRIAKNTHRPVRPDSMAARLCNESWRIYTDLNSYRILLYPCDQIG